MIDFDAATFTAADSLGLAVMLWITAGAVVLMWNDVGRYCDHVEQRYIERHRRLAPPWFAHAMLMIAIFLWPAILYVMAKAKAARR